MATLDPLLSEEPCEGETQLIKSFLYHRLTDDRALSRLQPQTVHEQEFKLHLELLDRWGFTTITLHDYLLFRQKQLHLPRKPVVLTIDDGTEDTYRVALPLLREAGCRAVVFVSADPTSRGNGWGNDGHRAKPLSTAHLRQLAAEGMEIGSLSTVRQSLTVMPPDAARNAIAVSRHHLEMTLGAPVVSFAYPFGQVNAAVKCMVEEAGYSFACSWSTGPGTFGDDLFEIRRFTVQTGLGAVGFGLRLHAPFELYEQCVQRTRSALAWMNHRQVIRV